MFDEPKVSQELNRLNQELETLDSVPSQSEDTAQVKIRVCREFRQLILDFIRSALFYNESFLLQKIQESSNIRKLLSIGEDEAIIKIINKALQYELDFGGENAEIRSAIEQNKNIQSPWLQVSTDADYDLDLEIAYLISIPENIWELENLKEGSVEEQAKFLDELEEKCTNIVDILVSKSQMSIIEDNDVTIHLPRIFEILSDINAAKGYMLMEPKYYTKAAQLMHYAYNALKENQENLNHEHEDRFYSRLEKLESGLLTLINVNDQILRDPAKVQIEQDKNKMSEIREYVSNSIKNLNNRGLLVEDGNLLSDESKVVANQFIQFSRNLCKSTTGKMKFFLSTIINNAQKILGEPPCDYTVVGLGSMALEQMTPYSDLEFAILIDGQDYIKNINDPRAKYFKNLSHLVHFRITNLGETLIDAKQFKVNLDYLIKKGISFDLGGKTPLGREDKPYCLIQTVSGMMHYLKNEGSSQEHRDKNLPFLLGDVSLVYEYVKTTNSENYLYTQYTKAAAEYLASEGDDGMTHHQSRAI